MSVGHWTKEQRQIAKEKKKRLFSIALTYAGGKGGFSYAGPATDEQAKLIEKTFLKLCEARK